MTTKKVTPHGLLADVSDGDLRTVLRSQLCHKKA
jgi:hypothetical protein